MFTRLDRLTAQQCAGTADFWTRALDILSGTGAQYYNPDEPDRDKRRSVMYGDQDRRPRKPLSYEEWDSLFEAAREAGVLDIRTNERGEHLGFVGPFGLALARLHVHMSEARKRGVDAATFWTLYDQNLDGIITRERDRAQAAALESAARMRRAIEDRARGHRSKPSAASEEDEAFATADALRRPRR